MIMEEVAVNVVLGDPHLAAYRAAQLGALTPLAGPPKRHRKRVRKRHGTTKLQLNLGGATTPVPTDRATMKTSPETIARAPQPLASTHSVPGQSTCRLCASDLPEERDRWAFLACCGRGVCRACLSAEASPASGEAPAASEKLSSSGDHGHRAVKRRAACPVCSALDCVDDAARVVARADAGCAESQYYLGQAYLLGELHDAPPDYERAAWYLRLAARQGHVEAAFKLALSYDDQGALGPNAAEARTWYAVGAARGHVASQIFLDELDRGYATTAPP